MARDRRRGNANDRRKSGPAASRRPMKKKICVFCSNRAAWVDYKDVNLLRKFVSERAKIRARRVTGNCAQHQREVAVAIKTARELALIPYQQRQMADRSRGGGRRRDREDGDRAPRPRRDESAPEAPMGIGGTGAAPGAEGGDAPEVDLAETVSSDQTDAAMALQGEEDGE